MSGGNLSASGGHLSASGGHCLPTDPLISYSGGQKIWRTCPRYFWRTTVRHRRIFVRGGQLSASCPPTFLKFLQTKLVHHGILADFLADCPRVDGGSDRIRSDPPRTLADFLSPHKVRLGPPESAKRKSSADTGADSGGQWRTQADPIGSAADSGGQLSASFSAFIYDREKYGGISSNSTISTFRYTLKVGLIQYDRENRPGKCGGFV